MKLKINERKVARLAACLAISNMGQQVPKHAAKDSKYWSSNPRWEVCSLAGHLMETDEHEEMFSDEAEMWAKTIRMMGAEEVLRVWTHEFVRDILTIELEEKVR